MIAVTVVSQFRTAEISRSFEAPSALRVDRLASMLIREPTKAPRANKMIAFDHRNKKASPEWLTSVLTRNGYLNSGEVIEVDQKPARFRETLTSEFFELAIKYRSKSTDQAPSNCLMKVIKPELLQFGKKEAEFYELARSSSGASPALLASYGTAVDVAAQSAVVLLEDKGDDFYVTEWPRPPQIDACKRAVRGLAAVHAMWWNRPELRNEGFDRLPDRVANLPNVLSRFSSFFDAVGDGLSKPRRAIVEQLLESYPRMLEQRLDETSAQTMIHGDAHFWNVLFPKDESHTPIWIDWQSWGVHFGACDLAYMIGLHWFPERRQRFEKELLATYLTELCQRGIDYTYDDLYYDYRLQIAGQIFTPILQWSVKLPASIWWPHLDRAFSAFGDLNCAELIR